ncbi:MAG: doubled motif LPXTG anchor domain-containing protein, partial [Clostridia bacterium]|nr:doubled motif LPXTG anchor domain-containing protein [Clostridia bacterium]
GNSENQDAGPIASLSRHYAPVVAEKQGDDVASLPENSLPEKHDSNVKIEEGTKEETKTKETTKETAEKHDESQAEPSEEKHTSDVTNASGEAETPGETEQTSQAEQPKESEPSGESPTESSAGEEKPEESSEESSKQPSDESTPAETTGDDITGDDITGETPVITIETEPSQSPEETEPEDAHKVASATSNDLVGIGYCSTAKVYTTTVNTLKALNDFDGYKVTYAVYAQGTARIVDGPRGVEEGGSLTFGVKTQVGYDIQSVSANGDILEAADPENETEDVTWFTVEDVADEQEVEVYTTETDEHPEFSDTIVVNDGMIISLYAPEGVLPKGVTATAERVDAALEDSIRENAQEAASEEGKNVSSVAAYDINLWLGNQKLDAGIWNQEGVVTVTFSGIPVEEASQTAEEMSIVHVEAEAADVKALEEVRDAVDVSGGRTVDALSFEAEHFSIYAVISKENITWTTVEVSKDEPFRVKANLRLGGSWSVSDPRVVSIQNVEETKENGKRYSVAEVKVLKDGKRASIWYGNVFYAEYFNIIINDSASQFHFKFNQDSSNISLWYSINGGGLRKMERGQVLQTAKTDIVSFYVKPADGYVTPTTFEHRNGKTEPELSKARYGEGIYVDIADAPSTISIDKTSQDFSSANAEAVSMGCTNQFHYSYRDEVYRYREFRIKATPAKINVKYDGNGAEGKAPVDNTIYSHPAIKNGTSYIEIKGPGNLKKNHFEFAGWELAETSFNQAGNRIYQKGDKLFVGDVWKNVNINPVTYTLTAKWNPRQYTLTTASDANSVIDQGTQYTYDEVARIKVSFAANQGYRISGIRVDGTELSGKVLDDAVQNGWVEVDCKQNHQVSVTSVRSEFKLTTNAQNADITGGRKYSYSDTATLDVKFKAKRGYTVTSITVDAKAYTENEIRDILAETDQQGYSHITLDCKQDHIVLVKADKSLYTLTAKADENSWINPQTKSYEYKWLGSYEVKFGAKDGYQIQNIIVDGTELSGIEKLAAIKTQSYRFDYKSSHTIEVTTRINSYHLTTDSDHNSWITPSMDFTYNATEKLKVEFGAKEGYSISGIRVDFRQYRGDELKEAVSKGYIELERDRDHIVTVTSKISEFTLTVGSDENSRITEPQKTVTNFTYDGSKCLVVKFKANTGYKISKVIVDDVSLEGSELLKALTSHSVAVDRKGSHSVYVEASPMEYVLTTGADLHSRITYPQDRVYTYSYDPEAMIEVTFEANQDMVLRESL